MPTRKIFVGLLSLSLILSSSSAFAKELGDQKTKVTPSDIKIAKKEVIDLNQIVKKKEDYTRLEPLKTRKNNNASTLQDLTFKGKHIGVIGEKFNKGNATDLVPVRFEILENVNEVEFEKKISQVEILKTQILKGQNIILMN
ncbi:hypothetical protein [Paenibacillus periandrae]|uniref:hypothetical protein n=1 Tax=Paenibacillus periandrae TaxID=1761741 RepID=UPI001F092042|nr:hypothetical protein [Paenibacillus periandrae]